MASKFSLHLLHAAVLVALMMLGASGAPFEDAATDSPAGDASGEEEVEMTSDMLIERLKSLLEKTKYHKEEFEKELHISVSYLRENRSSIFPKKCPDSNFSKEACLRSLAQGLLKYTVLLKHVEREYPRSPILSAAKNCISPLIEQIKQRMRNRALVVPLTSSQEEELLKDFDNPDAYHRKMAAHSILDHLNSFLADGKRSICRREKQRGAVVCRTRSSDIKC